MPNTEDRYCIIGAGPSGLATAHEFKRAGIAFDVFERYRDAGGIWDIENPGTPMYDSAHFISSRTQSAFDDFPMPADYPDYPSRTRILEYLHAYANDDGIREHITFGTEVAHAEPADGEWDVTLSSGEHRRYRGVVCAVGNNWNPVETSYPGHFDGEMYHSSRYKYAASLAGKRVLVVGGGNSGCDIACDAAPIARETLISFRRGYHFLPKHLFGVPTDAFFRSGPHLPAWLAQPLLTLLLRILVGDLRRYKLPKPDHKVLESHPIVNSQLLHYLTHGDVRAVPDVRSLDGARVTFVDGTSAEVDVIIFATGFRSAIPCLDAQVFAPERGGAQLYLNVFAEQRGLYVVGLFETDGSLFPVVSKQAALVASVIRAQHEGSERAAWFERRRTGARPDLTGGIKYLASQRHAFYVQYDEYVHRLEKMLKRMGAHSHGAA
ncbi:MAG TPA: NAD(P)-binding domain-containing protein [Gemmatimonadaceae bacterium]|nr:NAD(P)-binding domain-containing protein [Gemmatimonadaceae bacterium]